VRWAAVLCVTVAQCAAAAPPSRAVIYSCLSAHAIAKSISVKAIPTTSVATEDNYSQGYNATYLLQQPGNDIGYAERNGDTALIYGGRIYSIRSARPLLTTQTPPHTFQAPLADWIFVSEAKRRYFCVSFNFDGLGQSGSYQNVRGGYLLPT
jgi:hypothetical protein